MVTCPILLPDPLKETSANLRAGVLQKSQAMERLNILMSEYRPVLNGERFLTDAELSERLKLSRRTLQKYHSNGKIAYYQLGTKILYKESDIEKLLNDNRQEAYR